MVLVIIGNGVAGISAAFAARERDDLSRIVVIGGESDYFFSRTALMYAFMDRLDRKELEPYERRVYDQKRIELKRAWVTDLDSERKQLTLKSTSGDATETLAFDRLLITAGSAPRTIAAEGLRQVKSGLVHFVSLAHLDACEAWTPTTRHAVVVGGGLIGIELVECLRHHGVQVTFLVREPWYWPAALGQEESEMVTQHMRHHRVDVRTEDQLARIETDKSGRVAAIETNRGERIECQLLGICAGVRPAIDFLASVKTPPRTERGIVVDAQLRTSLADVWAAGDCAELHLGDEGESPLIEQIWYSAKRQGEVAGANLTGAAAKYRPPLFYNSAKLFDIEYTTVGQVTRMPLGAASLYRQHPKRPISQRIVHLNGRVIGFNMLGSRWDHSLLTRWIEEERKLEWVVDKLRKAQFDVEFGRVKLADLRESALLSEAGA